MKTGNISTLDLLTLIERNLAQIEAAFETYTLVEIDRFAVSPVT